MPVGGRAGGGRGPGGYPTRPRASASSSPRLASPRLRRWGAARTAAAPPPAATRRLSPPPPPPPPSSAPPAESERDPDPPESEREIRVRVLLLNTAGPAVGWQWWKELLVDSSSSDPESPSYVGRSLFSSPGGEGGGGWAKKRQAGSAFIPLTENDAVVGPFVRGGRGGASKGFGTKRADRPEPGVGRRVVWRVGGGGGGARSCCVQWEREARRGDRVGQGRDWLAHLAYQCWTTSRRRLPTSYDRTG